MSKTIHYSSMLLSCLVIAGCSSQKVTTTSDDQGTALGYTFVPSDNSILSTAEPIPIAEKPYPGGTNNESYVVRGKRYHVLDTSKGYSEVGIASWYGDGFHGEKTSIGEIYDQYEYSAAHKSLPLPSYAKVTNLSNGTSVVVRINDRGPFVKGRIIDLSYSGATKLGIRNKGIAKVRVEALAPYQYRNKSLAAAAGVSTGSYEKYQKASLAQSKPEPVSTSSNSGYEVAEIISIPEALPIAETIPVVEPLVQPVAVAQPLVETIPFATTAPIIAPAKIQQVPAAEEIVAEPVVTAANSVAVSGNTNECVKGQNKCLQVGAFSKRSSAEQVVAKIRNILNRRVTIKTATSNGKPVHIVLVGPLDPGEFKAASEAIHKQGVFGRFISY